MITVTRPFLPPIEEYTSILQGIWSRNWLTNDGPLVKDLEQKLADYLGVSNVLYVSNGTIALQLAIKALGLKGEIITTPFSYVATTSSIVWEGCVPKFVDIDKNSLNIDPSKIEEAITDRTSAILATHCFGNPCDVESISKLASKHKLKVIYDAAHCFGTEINGKSIFSYGDISTTSFHATKLFHTIEGGALFTNDKKLNLNLKLRRNFGHDGPEKFSELGINGKNSEIHAAMGLCNLKYINEILLKRKEQCSWYDQNLEPFDIHTPTIHKDSKTNFAYYPAIFKSEKNALQIKSALEAKGISPRRYFYPSLSSLKYVDGSSTPISDDISSRILCLPLYHDLSINEQRMVVDTIAAVLN